MKRIVTHADPDLDAIVSAWIAQDFLFQAHASEVLFVNRKVPEKLMQHADCLVDVGNVYCPENYRFDHKPPAFENRNSTCAARLIYEYLLGTDVAVRHLAHLVEITYQGDTHRNSEALKQSRIDGPHAKLKQLKTEYEDTAAVYQQMVLWLRSYTKDL
ncbi:MYG1 family protein [Candidatus Poribacteria bacterium]|nr:MYG1 family protein [Candidatus Poribacteria bacterium]MYK19427.1 MYG1 family protein [Candidatus Poribacteria bacterium]